MLFVAAVRVQEIDSDNPCSRHLSASPRFTNIKCVLASPPSTSIPIPVTAVSCLTDSHPTEQLKDRALNRGNVSEALDALRAATAYELGRSTFSDYVWNGLYPVFVRGEAYLAAHQASEAAAEFQKIIDHRGIVWNSPIGALALLQLGRAYAMQGDAAKAKAAYQDFLTLWKAADPDIPVLIAAKSEYAKLQ